MSGTKFWEIRFRFAHEGGAEPGADMVDAMVEKLVEMTGCDGDHDDQTGCPVDWDATARPVASLDGTDDNGWTIEDRHKFVLEAAEPVVLAAARLLEAATITEQGNAANDLSNAVSDLKSWLPGYEYESGTIPAEREEW